MPRAANVSWVLFALVPLSVGFVNAIHIRQIRSSNAENMESNRRVIEALQRFTLDLAPGLRSRKPPDPPRA